GNLLNEALRRQSDLRVNERYLHQLEEEVAQRRDMMEELNKAKEQAELALQVKGMFLANMSHELRTPMSAVLGITELLLDEDLDVEHRQQLQTVYDSADHLLKLLNELLDLSRIEQGSIELNAEPFSLRSCVEDAMRIARPLAQGKSLRVESHVEEAVAPAYVGDAARLYQVLVNLLGNAIKFTSEGGVRVEVTTTPSEINGDAVRIAVVDTGIGIPPDKKAAIFDAFTQVDSSITREFGGTGLGLAICQEIVQMMGSSIAVDSEVGSGSTFYFTLDLPKATEYVKEKPVEAPHREQPENVCRVLLAEDVLINQKIVQSMLGKRGHAVVTVDTGSAALELLQRDRNFDIVLMDMHMPSMGGIEATVKLREYEREHQLKPLKISALTANAMEEDRQMCVEAGMDFYLTKPFSADELLALVEQGN
ncbi:MAG: ATP-binding protein, partial [Candidatus Latescibacterota bacterium]